VKIASAEDISKVVYVDDIHTTDVAEKIVNGIRFYRSETPTTTTFVAANYYDETKILYLDSSSNFIEVPTGSGTAIATDMDVYFTKWKNTLYVVSGNTVIQKISYSAGWSRTNITGNSNKPQYITCHKDRIWVAGGDIPQGQLQCSSYDNDAEWGGTGTSATFNVGYQDGDPITALVSLGNDLIVYKNDSIYAMVGDNLKNWYLQKREDAYGCVCPKSAVDIGFGHVFLSADNIYYYDGTQCLPIGNNIKPWLDIIPSSLRDHCAGIYFNNYYRLSFPSSDMNTYNNEELLLDVKYFKAGKVSWWLNDNRNIAAYIPCDGPSDANTIYICDDNLGYVRQIEIGTQDDSTDFTMEWHAKYFVFDDPNIEKNYNRIKIDHSRGVGNINITVIKNLNDEYTLPITVDASGTGNTFGSSILGTTYWASQSNTRMTTEIALPSELDGSALSYKIIHNSNYSGVVFYGFSINWKNKRF
jgi:hypothetical protein